MIVVTIELWPRGRKEKARVLQTLQITNIGGDVLSGEYSVDATAPQADLFGSGVSDAAVSHSSTYRGSGTFADAARPTHAEVWKRATGFRHDRRQSPTHLLVRALAALGVRP